MTSDCAPSFVGVTLLAARSAARPRLPLDSARETLPVSTVTPTGQHALSHPSSERCRYRVMTLVASVSSLLSPPMWRAA